MTILTRFDLNFGEALQADPQFTQYTTQTSDDLKYDGIPVFNLGALSYLVDDLIQYASIPAQGPSITYDVAVPAYGTCDSPEQIIEMFGEALDSSPRNFLINAYVVMKADEPERGGWRWHKHGSYYGSLDPHCEYLVEEADEITQACAFTIHEVDPNRVECHDCMNGWAWMDDAGVVRCSECHGENSVPRTT